MINRHLPREGNVSLNANISFLQTVKRPTSAGSTSSNSRSAPANQRARSNSSSGRQTPTTTRPSLKGKST